MLSVRRLIALVLLGIWLPATLHCDLEAAGLDLALLCHDHAEADVAAHCADEKCHAIESADYAAVSLLKLIDSPALVILAVLIAPLESPARISPERAAVPPEIPIRWQFAHRAAPPARAPSIGA